MELAETAERIGEEHQAKAAQDSIEGAGPKAEGLTVFNDHGRVWRLGKASLCLLDHVRRNVGGREAAVLTNDRQHGFSREASTGGDVQNALTGLDTTSADQE